VPAIATCLLLTSTGPSHAGHDSFDGARAIREELIDSLAER